MQYYSDAQLLIRDMTPSDALALYEAEIAQGYKLTGNRFETRIADSAAGKCVSLVAQYENRPAGYVNVYIDSPWGSFGNLGYCEIIDFGVLEKYRRLGIGTRLMDVAEQIAGSHADTVYLGVGMHSGYGSAQRMYVKRGYIPDGKGVWYDENVAQPYQPYNNDDSLILYLSKRLR